MQRFLKITPVIADRSKSNLLVIELVRLFMLSKLKCFWPVILTYLIASWGYGCGQDTRLRSGSPTIAEAYNAQQQTESHSQTITEANSAPQKIEPHTQTNAVSNIDYISATVLKPPAMNRTVTSKGSFTAWAEPERPSLAENYFLHILVNFPDTTTSYSIRDLEGSVVGSDGYFQQIGSNLQWGSSSKTKNQALIKIFVPGSYVPTTLDTIEIYSKILNERQTLEVRFP